jgi:5'-3' exoribonuclease 1
VDTDLNEEINFADQVSENAKQERYIPGWQLAKRLNISSLMISRLTSSFYVTIQGSDKKTNIGLGLKFDAKNLKALGHAQKTEQGWEYSSKAVALLTAYKAAFPQVFRVLQIKKDVNNFEDCDFFSKNPSEGMEAISSWLKENGVRSITYVSTYVVSLDVDFIKKIELAVDAKIQKSMSAETELIHVKGIPRKNILKPSHSRFRLEKQNFSLGDRVVSTVDEGNVPLGARGTVIGLQDGGLDVLFDFPFIGGSDLGGRCSPYRGKECSSVSLLNLTNYQPPFSTKEVRILEQKQNVPRTQRNASNKSQSNQWSKSCAPHSPTKSADAESQQVEEMLKEMLQVNGGEDLKNTAANLNDVYSGEAISPQFLSMLQSKIPRQPDNNTQNFKRK